MPTSSNTHVDRATSKLLIKRSIAQDDMIHEKIFQRVEVERDSDLYYKFNDAGSRLYDTRRADTARANSIDYGLSTDTFQIYRHALSYRLGDDVYANADEPIKARFREDIGETLRGNILLRKEYDAAQMLFNTTNFSGYTTALTSSNQFDNYSGDDPMKTLQTYCRSVYRKANKPPNFILFGGQVWDQFINNPNVLSRLPDNNGRSFTEADLGRLLRVNGKGIENVFVGSTAYNSGTDDSPVDVDIWGNFILIAHIDYPRQGSIVSNALCKQFVPMANKDDVSQMQLEAYREPGYKATTIELNAKWGYELTNLKSGYLLSNVISNYS